MSAALWLPFAAAPIVGSFLGVLILRLPVGAPVLWSRSRCPACGHALGAAELVPVLSYALLRGRCRHCRAPIGGFHPAIEAAAVLVPAAALFSGARTPGALWLACALGWPLLALAVIDARTTLLPDALTLPLVLGGLAVTALTDAPGLAGHAAAAGLGWLLFAGIDALYLRLRGRHGLGAGDAKLFAAGGAWLGLASLPTVLLAAALLGLAGAGALTLSGRKVGRETLLPFGPALAAAIFAVWLTAT